MLELYLNDGISLDGFLEWENDNLNTACANLEIRKPVDTKRLGSVWDQLAEVRRGMAELPPGALD
jgi:hypothetical protein